MKPGAALLCAAAAVAAVGCGGGQATRFNTLPSGAATAPASGPPVVEDGGSTVTIDGELDIDTERAFDCSRAPDDFFVRGALGRVEETDVYFSLNVEFYKGPGNYPKKSQVLVRQLSDDGSFSATWYAGHATVRVHPGTGGADLEVSTLVQEAGSNATKPLTVSGHMACRAGIRSVGG